MSHGQILSQYLAGLHILQDLCKESSTVDQNLTRVNGATRQIYSKSNSQITSTFKSNNRVLVFTIVKQTSIN